MRLDPQLRNQKTNASRHASKQQASQTLMKEMMSEKNFHNSSDMVTLAPGKCHSLLLVAAWKIETKASKGRDIYGIVVLGGYVLLR